VADDANLLEQITAMDLFPVGMDGKLKPLDPVVIPEPPRAGEDPAECEACGQPDEDFVWASENWRIRGKGATPFPGMLFLETREHYDSFGDLTDELAGEVGPLLRRIERALLSRGDVGRVHFSRWGDGSAHFHVWVMPRPLGAMQLRGTFLPFWEMLLENLPEPEVREAWDHFAKAMQNG